jgi:predicted Zn-dependent protease
MATMTMDFGHSRFAGSASVQAGGPVRLTARGRFVVRTVVALIATVLAFVVLSMGKGAVVTAMTHTSQAVVANHSVVVRSGETMWAIAARELPGIDPREGISRIRTLNGMDATDVLVAGATLDIPTV